MKPDLNRFLSRLTNRSRLNDAEERAILELPTFELRVPAHRDFVQLDTVVNHVSVVVEGVVARFGQNAEGERQIIALHIAGDAPDLHTVVVPSDTVPLQALSNTVIARVPHNDLRTVAAQYPAVAEAFWRHCSVDAAITARWVLNVGRRDAKTRVAHLLCEMAVRYDATVGDGEVTYPFPLTQTHLADATGMTAVHMNRTLKALAAEGLVTLSGRVARIPNWERLVERAEFNPEYLQAGLQTGVPSRTVDRDGANVRWPPVSDLPANPLP